MRTRPGPHSVNHGRAEPALHCHASATVATSLAVKATMTDDRAANRVLHRDAHERADNRGNDMITPQQLTELNNRIVELVQDCWNEHHMPLLLSRLGSHDRGEIARIVKQHSSNLRWYLRNQLADDLQVVQHSTKPQLVGVLPRHVDVDADDDGDSLLEKTIDESVVPGPRYHPAFWAAFRKPLDKSRNRYMSIRSPIQFQDSPSAERPDGFIQITSEYVAGPHAEHATVQQRVQEWLADNKLQPSVFLSTGASADPEQPADLLDRLLHALDPSDLERITMPLDVVRKLRQTPP